MVRHVDNLTFNQKSLNLYSRGPSLTAVLVEPYNGKVNFDLSSQPLFGARSETSSAFDVMKKIGYPLSLGFLIFTLIIQLHEYKHISRKKKTISKHLDTLVVAGLVMLYLDLIRRSWEKELNIDFKQCKGCKGRDFVK